MRRRWGYQEEEDDGENEELREAPKPDYRQRQYANIIGGEDANDLDMMHEREVNGEDEIYDNENGD